MSGIRVLPPEVASRIAAGEVIERPASVVKELVENALDAAATQVTVEVEGGGVRLIRVSDNGCGMAPQEVEVAFERHATSKLGSLEDLQRIRTLGFRGEALPSIAAAAQVDLVTRTEGEITGVYLALRDGQIKVHQARARQPGTTVTVRDLFGSIPARRKFLRTPATEASNIAHLLTQYALVRPKVRFELLVDGRRTLQTPGTDDRREAVAALYGLEVAQALLEVRDIPDPTPEEESDPLRPAVEGLTSPPSLHRATRSSISLFVNGRWVQSRLLTFAVEEAYHSMLPGGRHPIAIVYLTLEPEAVDVNVHPAKSEVRFLRERQVFAALQRAVRATLVAAAPIPTARPAGWSGFPAAAGPGLEGAGSVETPAATPGGSGRGMPTAPTAEVAQRRLWLPTEHRHPPAEQAAQQPSQDTPPPKADMLLLRVMGQVASTYIIAEGPDGMYLIDQHAAHERVVFERLWAAWSVAQPEVQGLLEPVLLELTPQQAQLLAVQTGLLAEAGFQLEAFGERSYLVRAIPAVLAGRDTGKVLLATLDELAEPGSSRSVEGWRERLAISLACHSAIRAGQVLSHDEMRELISQLERSEAPRTCPHGRPTMIHLTQSQLEREFGRR